MPTRVEPYAAEGSADSADKPPAVDSGGGLGFWARARKAVSPEVRRANETEEEASRALEIAAERTARWDEEEAAEDAWRTGDPQARDWDANPLNG